MRVPTRFVLLGIGVFLFAAFAGVRAWAEEYSHVRIVRLSFTEGTVTVQRPDVGEWAEAPTNTPITEGLKLQTNDNSFAEVEFENSSTARLGQLSLLEFTQLALASSGAKVNRITLHQGYATFNTLPEGDDSYEVKAGDATLTPYGKTRFRLDFEEGMLVVKVFKGSVEVMSPEGTGTLGKNTVLQIAPGEEEPFLLSQGITKDAWDEWVEERENRVEMVRNAGPPVPYSTNVSDLMFGSMDLVYFGNWVNLPGYGPGWAPFAGPGWSPFTVGRWCWYPSFGYTWISYEPWGWLPYHYGAWIYDPMIGWTWIPTGVNMWQPAVVNWYRGPGWVGWAPMSPMLGGTQSHCPRAQGCVTTVNDDAFRNGRPILPDGIRWTNHFEGQPIARPELAPYRQAMLPGNPYAGAGALGGHAGGPGRVLPGRTPGTGEHPESATTGVSTGRGFPNSPATNAIGSHRTPSGNEPGIVFDPEQRRYVNNPSSLAAPASAAAPTAADAPSSASGLVGRRPGPQGNYPAPVATGVHGPRPGTDRMPANAPGATRSDDWGTRDRGAGSLIGSQGAGSHGNDSTAGASSARSAPSGGSRSESGSGAGSLIGSSSRSDSGRSEGGHSGGSSSSPSGGWSSGSSGGSHSSGSWGGASSGGGARGNTGGGSGGHSSTNSRR